MLLLAYLMTRTDPWNGAKIRMFAASSVEGAEKTLDKLHHTLENVRIDAEPEAVSNLTPEAVFARSGSSSLMFFPLRFRESHLVHPYDVSVRELLNQLPLVALTVAAGNIDIGAEPDEGKAAELTATLDTFEDAKKKTLEAEQELGRLNNFRRKWLKELREAEAQCLKGTSKIAVRLCTRPRGWPMRHGKSWKRPAPRSTRLPRRLSP